MMVSKLQLALDYDYVSLPMAVRMAVLAGEAIGINVVFTPLYKLQMV